MLAVLELSLRNFKYPEKDDVVVREIDLKITEGECLAIMGPSGCGKTTVFRTLAGLLPIPEGCGAAKGRGGGVFNIAGKCATPAGFAVAFQDHDQALLPWLTVWENLRWAANHAQSDRPTADDGLINALSLVGMSEFDKAYPHELSGGQRQRVALARAIVHSPSVLLMDEPFSSLDVFGRHDMEDVLLGVKKRLNLTVFVITHEPEEAVLLGDRVLVLEPMPTVVKHRIDVSNAIERGSEQFTEKMKMLLSFIEGIRNEPNAVAGQLR